MGNVISFLLGLRNSVSIVPSPIIRGVFTPQSVAVPDTETADASAIYRFPTLRDEDAYQRALRESVNGKNWVQLLEERCKEFKSHPAMAYRRIERVEKRSVTDSTGKERSFDYYHMSKRHVVSFEEMWHYMISFGSGLKDLGVPERSPVVIYDETRWEWIISVYGLWTQNMVASTVYTNLGEDALAYALGEVEPPAVITRGSLLSTLLTILRKQDLKPIVVCLDTIPENTDMGDFQVVSWTDVVERGVAAKHPPLIPTNNNTEGLIMYTSGTTGNPKGVVHTHGSIASGIRDLTHRVTDLYPPSEGGIYCAYLPLAHILEFGLVNISLNRGALVAFCNPRTITDTYAVPHGDFKEYRPNFIVGVPRIFDTIKKAAMAKLPPPGSIKRAIFDRAYSSRLASLKQNQDTPYWNDLCFKEIRALLGGNVYSMLSGGGPLSQETQEFVNVCFGGPIVIQGWGLTETVCCGTTQRLDYIEAGDVGQPVHTAEVRLLDTEDYKHTDQPEPRGEILVRGPFLFKGYYKQEKLTAEAIDKDGWFHTGDVGSMGPNGTLRIVGRVKALAKNVLGEYIAMEQLEAIYAQNPLCIPSGVCVLVHPDRSYITALVLTTPEQALKFAKAHNIDGDIDEVLKKDAFHVKVTESLVKTAKAAKRMPFEYVKFVRVLADEWTPENGLLTPTSKIRRAHIEKHYAELVSHLFSQTG